MIPIVVPQTMNEYDFRRIFDPYVTKGNGQGGSQTNQKNRKKESQEK